MRFLFIILGFTSLFGCMACYELNQTVRKNWMMNLIGIIGYILGFMLSPILFGIGFSQIP